MRYFPESISFLVEMVTNSESLSLPHWRYEPYLGLCARDNLDADV